MLPPSTHIGAVTLVVRNLGRMLDFYEGALGFVRTKQEGSVVTLSASHNGRALVVLDERPQAQPHPRHAPGLFHTAFLYPSRKELARILKRLVELGMRFHGFADHIVSEALYLADPEGNGVELYADRPRDRWRLENGHIAMATDPLDLEGLMAELSLREEAWHGTPPDTMIGHMHLQVSDLTKAEAFWSTAVGFDVTQRDYPGVLFVAAGGYHHHVGLNVWNSGGTSLPAGEFTGLKSFSIVLPSVEAVAALGKSLAVPVSHHTLTAADDDGLHVEFTADVPTVA